MFKPTSLFIGLRYIRSRQSSGFSSFISASSTIGIAIGVMVLILVLSAMNGFENALAKRLLSVVPHGELMSFDEPLTDWPAAIQKVQKHQQVVAAAPVTKMVGIMQKKDQLKAVEVRAVDANFETQVSDIKKFIVSGEWSAVEQVDNIVLGSGIARALNVDVGDTVQMLLPKNAEFSGADRLTNAFPVPVKRNMQVGAIFDFGGTIDETLVYVNLAFAQQVLSLPENAVQGIRLKVDDVFGAPRIARDVGFSFTSHTFYIYDWTRTQGHLFNDIQLVRMVMFIVLVMVIAVASFNIVSTLIMAVNEKRSDIAILKTMGASRLLIMNSFIIQGLANGIIGCTLGALAGVYLAQNLTNIVVWLEGLFDTTFLASDIYFIDFIPSTLMMEDVYFTVITALTLSFVATIYPAWRATKIEPAQVLGQA